MEPSWTAPFSGLSPRRFGKLVPGLRRQGADAVRKGRPWNLPLEDWVLLVAAYWHTNLTMRQLAAMFGVSKSAADRFIDHPGQPPPQADAGLLVRHRILCIPWLLRRYGSAVVMDAAVGAITPLWVGGPGCAVSVLSKGHRR
jgi:hypothetical protein